MASKQILFLTVLVGFLCLSSGAEIRKILEELLEDNPKEEVMLAPPMPPRGSCFRGGKMYRHRQRFVDEDCTASCKCFRGGIRCKSLCPPSWAECGPNEIEVIEYVKADREGKCKCPSPVCRENTEIL